MVAVFSQVAPLIIKAEGTEYTNRKNDRGGPTKYGISKRAHPDVDIENLTEEGALAILEQEYWNRYDLHLLEDQVIANQIFFMIVNMGGKRGVTLAQTAINAIARPKLNIPVDGIMGFRTVQALNVVSGMFYSNRLRLEEIYYYLKLTDDHPDQIENFRGWVRRALM